MFIVEHNLEDQETKREKYLYANSFMAWLHLVTFSAMGTIWISCDHITGSTNTQTSTSLLVYREQKHNCNVAVEGIIAVQHNIPKPYQGQVTYICSIPKFNSSIER